MCLSARDQRLLDQAGEDVARSDARLASMLAIFARLTAGEAMPDREQMSAPGGPGGRAGPVLRALASAMTRLITWLDRVDSPHGPYGQPERPGQQPQAQGSR
jgi:hypothetical protein